MKSGSFSDDRVSVMTLSQQLLKQHANARDFASTHWSVVLLAGKDQSAQSAAALDALCRIYWFPLYSFARKQGYNPHESADLTQEFFTRLLSTDAISTVSPHKGKFRSFLIASFKNLLTNEWHRLRAQKRGGGVPVFSLDEALAEDRYQLEGIDDLSPDKLYDRRWAETVLSRALNELRAECDTAGKARRFDSVKTFLIGSQGEETMAETAARMGMSLSGFKAQVHRLRQRFRELIRKEIGHTVASPSEIDQELRELFSAFDR